MDIYKHYLGKMEVNRGYPVRTAIFKHLIFLLLILGIISSQAFAANFVKGKVTDADSKKPLPGTTVSIPDLRVGGITDEAGEFQFEAPAGDYTVEAKFIGYESQSKKVTVVAGKTATVNFALSTHSIQTNEIVVVGLTGEVDKSKLGNTIASVSGQDVARVVSTSAIDAISGRVAGVDVTRNSGTPGAGTFITIRGRKTIQGGSEPLYVVDGVVIDNSALYDPNGAVQESNRAIDINPLDIESIQILKGASAAAIYGSQAANGVIIINTRHGKISTSEKPAQITYSSSVTVDNKFGTIPLQTTYGQLQGTNTSYGPALPAGTTVYKQDNVPFRTAVSHTQSLTLSGGVPQFDYLINGTYEGNQGYVIGSNLDRTNLRANVGISVLPGITIQTNSNFIALNNDLPQDGSNPSGILLGSLRTPPNFNNEIYLNPDGSQHRYAAYDNPLWTQHFNTYNSKIERFIHSTELKWMLFDWVTLSGRLGLDRYSYNNTQRLAVGSAVSDSRLGNITHNNLTNKQTNIDLTANFHEMFFENLLDVNLIVGSQILWYYNTQDIALANVTLPFYDQVTAGASRDASSYAYDRKIVGLFAQLTSTIWNRLSFTLSVRRDGSSTFGEAQQFHTYPKASFSYTLSDEEFMKDIKPTISNIRVRGSWGEAGSPNLPGIYATNFLYGTGGFFDPWGRASTPGRGGFIGIRQGGGTSNDFWTAGALDINPELSIEREVGLDLGFLNNAITLEATFYHSDVFDMIISLPVAPSTGYDQVLRNAAQMWNEGYELSLKANPIQMEDFSWSTGLNYSRNYNLVTKLEGTQFVNLNGGFTGMTNIAMQGRPLGVFYGYAWLRDESGKVCYSGDKIWVDADGADVRAPNGGVYRNTKPTNGVTQRELADDYQLGLLHAPVQDYNLQVIGDPNPQWTLSWRNDITILKDFSLTFLFDGVFGQDVWNGTKGALYNFGTHGSTADRYQPWFNFDGQAVINSADGTQAQKISFYRYYSNGFNINEPFVEKASFVKLRELTLAYRWHGLKDWNINTIEFSVSVRNLFTITNYDGFDPEVNTFSQAEGRGYDYFSLPQIRSYRFGINIIY